MFQRFLLLFVSLLLAPLSGYAGDRNDGPGQGLQVSLATSGYRFSVASDLAVVSATTRRGGPVIRPTAAFTASVQLNNFSNTDLDFTFPTPLAASRHFQFRVLDRVGAEVWLSDVTADSPAVETVATLRKRGRWSLGASIPLKVNGAWLPAGLYTLEARLTSDPQVSATALFEVVWPVITTDTGVTGQVFQEAAVTTSATAGQAIVAPTTGVAAYLDITEIQEAGIKYDHTPFTWKGLTDPVGNFRVVTPPGKFKLVARAFDNNARTVRPLNSLIIGFPVAEVPKAEATVEVQRGQFTAQNLILPPLKVRPILTTGISGFVVQHEFLQINQTKSVSIEIRPIRPPIALPVAGATVIIEAAGEDGVVLPSGSGGFSWTGITDAYGTFQAETPAGNYRVSIYRQTGQISGMADLVSVASKVISVSQGQVAFAYFMVPLSVVRPRAANLIPSVGAAFVNQREGNWTITASGTVPTGGYRDPKLTAQPGNDSSILDLDFTIVPPSPSSIVTQAFVNHQATLSLPVSATLQTIRIHGQGNVVTLSRATGDF